MEPFGPGCPWYGMYERFGAPNVKWCEERVCAWANEPANTWSNLAFLAVAAFIWFRPERRTSPLVRFFSIAVFFMGLFSLIFHATNNFLTQIFDFVGMYFYVYLLMTLNLYRLKKVTSRGVVSLFMTLVASSVLLILLLRAMEVPYQWIIAFGAVGIIVTEWNAPRVEGIKFFAIALGFFAIAEAFSLLDMRRVFCDPAYHGLQGHSIWHVLSAVGVGMSYRYYRPYLQVAPKT